MAVELVHLVGALELIFIYIFSPLIQQLPLLDCFPFETIIS